MTLSIILSPSPPPHHPHPYTQFFRRRLQCYIGLAILFSFDHLLRRLFRPITSFPSPLIGMAIILTTLILSRRFTIGKPTHNHNRTTTTLDHLGSTFFHPTVEWVAHKWLPVFYSPALVSLPLVLQPLPPEDLVRSVLVISIGVVCTAGVTAHTAMFIRRHISSFSSSSSFTSSNDSTPEPAVEIITAALEHQHHDDNNNDNNSGIHFTKLNIYGWTSVAVCSTVLILLDRAPPTTSTTPTSALLLASTVLGYMGGMSMPAPTKAVLHPMVVTALVPNAVCYVVGEWSGAGYDAVLRSYLTKATTLSSYGPGDVLFSFLGVIILSFGFKVYEQWEVLCKHGWEVGGATVTAAAFTMLSTAALGRLAALPPALARGLIPRGATLALALPIADRLGAPPEITAAAVALTGIIGCNFIQLLLTMFGARDPISRGLAAAATAHGLGTAAMAAREPDALPFAALSYALCGISATVLANIPWFSSLLLHLTSSSGTMYTVPTAPPPPL